ncbi:M20/M25/M40 family metallo-hydrolase [Streptomyces sp. V3I7]|uniref:M20/M25/M40 family metallo-hydrolase n=1 Tax=Streptomyces sp. V3I7 TaxID=3042278 RepID=UPI002783667F|nr:M20/M25/M40 family metallo-hydrolase [Streptomyces sp. V3I7]MDQ0994388.1 acetylornithine deacetylase/succinyl-diaminopimelate desuccinylase-like protein [Streptomyces sp. V3I7]
MTAGGAGRLLGEDDHALLLRLLRMPTAGPLETGDGDAPLQLWQAQHAYAEAAREVGMRVVHHAAPDPAVLLRPDVPAIVRAAAGPVFLAQQPSLVLRLGAPALPVRDTVMFNVHLDTVSGTEPVGFDGERFTGRGAVDAKGPAVALLAGVRAAAAAHPGIGRDTAVVIQAVSGEEGGAMGTFGTRPLIEAGHVGRLNVFCEPTGLRHMPRATASMTARITVEGEDAIDDRPGAGHNATVLLGFLAQHLAAAGGSLCIAGLHTGHAHNRVYGTGQLLVNIPYATPAKGAAAERLVEDAFTAGLKDFTDRFDKVPGFARTAADAVAVTRLRWDKRGLPCLARTEDPWGEDLLAAGGVPRQPDSEPAFTCDAIWMQDVPGTFTTVLGPGSLDANHAHASGEFVDLADLEEFADTVRRLLLAFADQRETTT